jgi:hypothetical protein
MEMAGLWNFGQVLPFELSLVKLGVVPVVRTLIPESLLATNPGCGNGRSTCRESQVGEDFFNNFLFKDSRDGLHLAAAKFTVIHVEREYSREKFSPGDAILFLIGDGQSFVANLLLDFLLWFLRHDKFSELGVRCQNAVKACEVNSWRGTRDASFSRNSSGEKITAVVPSVQGFFSL